MSLTFADLFCGAGGSINGMVDAGLELIVGANHSPRAIETVSTNHRNADFLCTDINHYDMRRLPHTDVLWASVICTEMSPAGGNKKRHGQGALDLEEQGHVSADMYERTRACALDVVRATEVHRYLAVVVENVVEFARDWELYDWWIEGMKTLGYNVQVVNVSAAHIYGDGNAPAPQWRDRIYIVFTRKDVRAPELNARPPSWCDVCGNLVEGEQWWKREDRRRVGKYGAQYLYRCPVDRSIVEPLVLPAISAIDIEDIGQRIGDRITPLKPKTMARIEWGVREFCDPIIAQVAGNTWEAPGSDYHRAWPARNAPLNTRTATGGDALACPPVMVNSNHEDSRVYRADAAPLPTRTVKIGEGIASAPFMVVNRSHNRPRSVNGEPMAPVTTGNNQAVVQPFITMLRRNGTATGVADEPLATVTGAGRHHWLTIPPGAFYVKNFGGNAEPRHLAKPLTDPLSPITTIDHHALVIPYRRGKPKSVGEPLHTLSTHQSAGLLQPRIDVNDCYYRMLKPREHLRAQRFYDDYIVTGNVGEQTMQAGNAVPCNVAQWIGLALIACLDAA